MSAGNLSRAWGVLATMHRRRLGLLALIATIACGGSAADAPVGSPASTPAAAEARAQCPSEPIDVAVAPGTRPEHRDVEFWLAKHAPAAADAVLVAPEAVADLNRGFSEVEGAWHDPLDPILADPAEIQAQLGDRMGWLGSRVNDGRMVEGQEGSFAEAERIVAAAKPVDALHLVVEEASLWCIPIDTGLYKVPIDRDFDRNRCASLHPGEVVRALRHSPDNDWWYVHSGHTTGWLHNPTLTPSLPATHLRSLLDGPLLVPTDDDLETEAGRRLRLGTRVPITGRDGTNRRVLVPTAEGLVEDTVSVETGANEGFLPLSRRAAWTLALSEQETPYGWGGRAGHRDCSRLMRDVLATFGFELARHSGVQGKLGVHNIDVSAMNEHDKLAALEEWSARGLVLLYMPGHIMMYLGEDEGQHYAVSAISEYLEPCEGGADTVFRIGRVAVTTLELGRGTERTAYTERLARLVVFGP